VETEKGNNAGWPAWLETDEELWQVRAFFFFTHLLTDFCKTQNMQQSVWS
jgi:hypothetical protein